MHHSSGILGRLRPVTSVRGRDYKALGLIAVDRAAQRRYPKDSLQVLGALAQRRSEGGEIPMARKEFERIHSAFVRENGAECTVLLKKDGRFPREHPGSIALYGSGARRTVPGGTGSGEVNSRHRVTIEEGLRAAGFTITSESWLDGYDAIQAKAKAQWIRDIRAEAKANRQNVMLYAMGRTLPEPAYTLPLDGDGDTAVYVLSRISGEGADRTPVAGDILLSSTEIRDILSCNQRYPNFMLVINAGGVLDLSPVLSVGNILVLSQLGAETGHILADLLLGRQTPSGKLTTTWARWEDYPTIGEFGGRDETRYREGIYVGYRYFDSVGKAPLFPFGYGLSYTEFAIGSPHVALNGTTVTFTASVQNTGAFPGKDVVQLYASLPAGKLDEPFQVLCGFAKTGLLQPGQAEVVQIAFAMEDIAPYDQKAACYILEAGDYLLRYGASSRQTEVCAAIRLDETVSVLQAKNVLGTPDFADWSAPASQQLLPAHTQILHLPAASFTTRRVSYDRPKEMDPRIEALSDAQLLGMNLGAFDPKGGIASMIGTASFTVAGAAGQSYMGAADIPSLVMADGPAGLRLSRRYAQDAKGHVYPLASSLPASLLDFMPAPLKWLVRHMTYKPKKQDFIGEQYATAIPIGTAVAQSFNLDLAEGFGRIVGAEMAQFGVQLWLAPALNIHRSIRCGRNFEYFSEDPLLSGLFAAAITRGVQSFPHAGVTIKHYAFNNQERNRTRNNSQLSERAAREIYLKAFGICVKAAHPKAVMTSYNLVNGTHTSSHAGLIEDILRAEFGHCGIVMTDWVVAGYGSEKGSVHPAAEACYVCRAGGDLFMPGSRHDYDNLKSALVRGTVTKQQLQIHATRVMRLAASLCPQK